MPGNDAITRLFQLQQTPAPAGTTAQDIARLLAMATQQQQAVDQAPLQNRLAGPGDGTSHWWDPRPEIFDAAAAVEQRNTPPGMSGPPPMLGFAPQPHTAETLPSVNAPAPPAAPIPPAQAGVPTADPTAPHPETLLEPLTEGSAVQGPQEATPLNAPGLDPATGEVVFTAPGVPGEIRLPPNLTPEQLDAVTAEMANRWRGADVFGPPGTAAVTTGRALEIAQGYARLVGQLAQQATGQPQGPLTQSTAVFERSAGAPVSPEHAAARAQARAAEQAAQRQADQAQLGVNDARTQGFDQRGDFLGKQGLQQQARDQAIEGEFQRRMGELDLTLRRVQSNQINPEAFFGRGVSGRIIPAIAVALGELGRGLTGDSTNRALQIIDSAVNRSVEAQARNQQADLQSAQLQGQALQHFRTIIGDQRGAEAATRTALYQAFINQIDSQMSRAQGANLAALQQLRAAMLQRRQAEGLVIQDATRFQSQIRIETTHRQRGGLTAEDASRAATIGAVVSDAAAAQAAPAQAPAAPQTTPEAPPSETPQDAPSAAAQAMGGTIGTDGSIELEGGIRIPRAVLNPLSPQAQDVLRAARERLAQDPNDRRAREIVASGRRRARESSRRVERTVRRQLPRFDLRQIQQWDVEDARHAMERIERRARGGTESGPVTPSVLPTGFRFMTPEDGFAGNPERQFQYMAAQGAGQIDNLYSAMDMVVMLDSFLPTITAARAEFGGTITDSEGLMVRASQMADEFRSRIMNIRTGANFGPEERDMYLRMMPDPSTITASNALGMWDRIKLAWENFHNTFNTSSRSILRQWAVTTDSTTGNARIRQRAQQEQETSNQAAAAERELDRTQREQLGLLQDRETDNALRAAEGGDTSGVLGIIRRARGRR